jgi:hypothetical protein
MKTKNNVQKAILKSLAVIVSSVLISFTVSAQGFWESLLENNTFNEIALAMVESNSETESTPIDNYSSAEVASLEILLEEEVEETLELEDWMTNEANFTSVFTVEEAVENPLEIEDWMKDETYFAVPSLIVEVEIEEALEVENWMLNTENFSGKDLSVQLAQVKDYELEIEPWMTDSKVWEN